MAHIKLKNRKVVLLKKADCVHITFRKLVCDEESGKDVIMVERHKSIIDTKLKLSSEAAVALYFLLHESLQLSDLAKFQKETGVKVLEIREV